MYEYTIKRHYKGHGANQATAITSEDGQASIERVLDLMRSAFANGAHAVDVTCRVGTIEHTQQFTRD